MDEPEDEIAEDLVFVPLGGLGEIGMNFGLYGLGTKKQRQWLVVDCGIGFPGPELPGIEVLLPDPAFLKQEGGEIVGIVITHAHEDHYGALLDLWPALKAPVYLTPFAAGLLRAKMIEETGRLSPMPLHVLSPGDSFRLGSFEIETIPMAHSIPEPIGIVLRTPVGTVFHSGDWKIDPDPGIDQSSGWSQIESLGQEGVDALVCDSTNALRPGRSASERDVRSVLEELIRTAPRRVIVTAFASNVGRMRSVCMAAAAAQRDVILVGRAMQRVAMVARELGYLEGIPEFLEEQAYGYIPPERLVVLCTGSQGESRAALTRLARNEHRILTLDSGDRVIFSSRAIPGNEKAVSAVLNALTEQGVDVITDHDALVHVSGHPRQEELRDLYQALRPTLLVPVHGEALHLRRHQEFALEEGIPSVLLGKNGSVLRLLPGPGKKLSSFEQSFLVRDGKVLVSPEESGVGLRQKMSFAGAVVVSIVLNRSGRLVVGPHLCAMGMPDYIEGPDHTEDVLEELVLDVLHTLPLKKRQDVEAVAHSVRQAVRAYLFRVWGKKPLCEVLVDRVG